MSRKLLWLLVLGFFVCLAPLMAQDYTFYEGNGGQQNQVCSLSGIMTVNFQNDPYSCENDEARSVVLSSSLKKGYRLTVTDDPYCRPIDDYTIIEVMEDLTTAITISSFEGGSYPSSIRFVHAHMNGLDGKVSCAELYRPQQCGDTYCTGTETCSTCSVDCSCGGGGGGGGGGDGDEELTSGQASH